MGGYIVSLMIYIVRGKELTMSNEINLAEQMPGKKFLNRTYSIKISGFISWTDTNNDGCMVDQPSKIAEINLTLPAVTVDLQLDGQLLFTDVVDKNFNFFVELEDTDDVCQHTLSLKVSGLHQHELTTSLAPAVFLNTVSIENLSFIDAFGKKSNHIVINNIGAPTTFIGQDCEQTLLFYTPIYHFLIENYKLIDHQNLNQS